MSGTFGELLNPIDETKRQVIRKVVELAGQGSIPIMLFGAFAREIHFYHAYNIEGGRATEDVDVSIQVPDWESYDRFAEILKDNGFKPKNDAHPEKLILTGSGVEVDLLPFGEIAEDGEKIIWPTDGSPWSVIGFDDAFAAANLLNIGDEDEGPVTLAVAPVPAILVLKLTAIHDRPAKRFKKDGTDIAFVISKYLDIGNRDRLQEGDDADVMGLADGDLDRASAVLVGRDIARMISEVMRTHVVGLIRHEVESNSRCHVIRGMTGSAYPSFPQARAIMGAVLQGVDPK